MKKELSFIQSLKNLKPHDFIYFGILALFFGIIVVAFFFAVQFISININKVFQLKDDESAQTLDIENYEIVAKKLNINIITPTDNLQKNEVIAPLEIPTNPPSAQTEQPVNILETTLDKKEITIIIRNSTAKKGAAATLAKIFKDDGFQKPQTGNELELYATTTIFLKESKRDYEPFLLETINKIYSDITATNTLEETSSFDAIIIIGTN